MSSAIFFNFHHFVWFHSDLIERREDDVVEGELNLRGPEEGGEVSAGAGALRLLLRRQPRLQRLDRHRVQRGEEVVQQVGLKTLALSFFDLFLVLK